MRSISQRTAGRPTSRREGLRRQPLHLERLELRSMLAADAGFVDDSFAIDPGTDVLEPPAAVEAPPADPSQEFVPILFICPGVPDLPTIDLPESKNGYLDEYERFLTQNPDWLAEHGADGIQACVMTPSRYVDGVELANPGEARAFDAWFKQEHPWYFVEPVTGDESLLPEDPVEFDDSDGESSGSWTLCVLPPPVFSVYDAGWMISSVAGGSVGGDTSGSILTGIVNLDRSFWLSSYSRPSDFGPLTLTLSGGEIVQRSSFSPAVRSAAFTAPFGNDHSAFAQLATSFLTGSSHGGETAAESLPGSGGRRRARA
jgi:hypothetical protein